jgi:hypothetical protein
LSGWPGSEEDATEAATEVRPPPPQREESTRAGEIRQAVRRGRQEREDLLVLAVLEVAAAVDRLTVELREGRSR